MKFIKIKFKKRKIKHFLLFLSFLFIFSNCSSQISENLYQKSDSISFAVFIKENEDPEFKVIDTLSFKIKGKGMIGLLLGLNIIEWNSTANKNYVEKRGINISNERIEIQIPIQLDYFNNEESAIAPYPSFSFTMKKGYTSKSEHDFLKGYGKLSGKTIHQFETVIDDSLKYSLNNETINCKVVTGHNTSLLEEYGKYSIVTYFNIKIGFVFIQYIYPSGKIIELRKIEKTIQ